MKRVPLKRSTKPLARRKGLKATPSKRARPDEPLTPWCEIGIPGICTGLTQHRHHILRRSAGGGDEAANTLDCDWACHAYVHAHPAISYERGWLRRRGSVA